MTPPLTTQARSLSAQNWVLELGDTSWCWGLAQHQLQDQEAGRASSTHDSGRLAKLAAPRYRRVTWPTRWIGPARRPTRSGRAGVPPGRPRVIELFLVAGSLRVAPPGAIHPDHALEKTDPVDRIERHVANPRRGAGK